MKQAVKYLLQSIGVSVEPSSASFLVAARWREEGGEKRKKKLSPPHRMNCTAERCRNWWKWLPRGERRLCRGFNHRNWHGCKVALYWSLWSHLTAPFPFIGRSELRVSARGDEASASSSRTFQQGKIQQEVGSGEGGFKRLLLYPLVPHLLLPDASPHWKDQSVQGQLS